MMRLRTFFGQFFWSFFFVTLAVFLATAAFVFKVQRDFYLDQVRTSLKDFAEGFSVFLEGKMDAGEANKYDAICKHIGKKSNYRVTLILPDGVVLGDSEADPHTMDNHATRPEIQEARTRREFSSEIRYSHTVKAELLYAAIPLTEPADGSLRGFLRIAVPLVSLERALKTIHWQLALFGGALLLLSSGVAWLLSRRASRPLERLRETARRFAVGDLAARLHPEAENTVEHQELADAFNRMAFQLEERLDTISRQRNEQAAIFSAMTEAVLAIDGGERILNLNPAAARLFSLDPVVSQGRLLREAIRHPEIQRFVEKIFQDDGIVEADLEFHRDQDCFLLAHGSPLKNAAGVRTGALLVFQDMTRLKHLENLRKEFVANVSHELRTPITSIKGFLEMLLEDKGDNPEETQRFLNIMNRQTGRLSTIIDDLLMLSRIETEDEHDGIPLEEECVAPVIEAVLSTYRDPAAEKKIRLESNCPTELTARVNRRLLEQAISNLLDNALKYSDPEKSIRIQVTQDETHLLISVKDEGCGIAAEHIPRLFERFYRVDKARSRKVGGTGLGLAIVKHIAKAHRGDVQVESELGRGSCFILRLPR